MQTYTLENEVIIVREGSLDEAVEVNQTICEFEQNMLGRDFFADRLVDKESLILVGQLADTILAGYLIAYDRYHDGSIYLWMTGVDPNCRQRGVLKSMVFRLEIWARERNFSKIRLKTRELFQPMISFLHKYGFSYIGKSANDRLQIDDYWLEYEIEI